MKLKKKKKKSWSGGFTRGFFFHLLGWLAGWPIWDFLGFEMEIFVVVWVF